MPEAALEVKLSVGLSVCQSVGWWVLRLWGKKLPLEYHIGTKNFTKTYQPNYLCNSGDSCDICDSFDICDSIDSSDSRGKFGGDNITL